MTFGNVCTQRSAAECPVARARVFSHAYESPTCCIEAAVEKVSFQCLVRIKAPATDSSVIVVMRVHSGRQVTVYEYFLLDLTPSVHSLHFGSDVSRS